MEQINALKAKANIIDYLIVLFIIAGTGFEWCFGYNEMIFFWVFPLAILLYLKRLPKLSINFLAFACLYLIWAGIQIGCGLSASGALFNFAIRLFIYYLALTSVKNLPDVIIRVMYYICIVSLLMYLICLIPQVREGLRTAFANVEPIGGFEKDAVRSNPGQTMIFYFLPSSLWTDRIRNPGPFWEPGMFAVFANIALAMQLLRHRRFTKETYIILAASISTFSTTGLIATFCILLYYFTIIHRRGSSIFLIVAVFVGIMAFINSDYGLEKIQDNAADSATYSRFGAIFYHLKIIALNPIIGNGFDLWNGIKVEVSPNGLSLIFAFWGIPLGILYYILLYRGVRNLAFGMGVRNTLDVVFLFVTFLIVVFSQDATNRHFYLAIMIYGLNTRKVIAYNITKQPIIKHFQPKTAI